MGLRTVFGFPIRRTSDILGVMEFFDTRRRQPDDALSEVMGGLGAQVGLFLPRRQAQDQVAALLQRERRAQRGRRGRADA